MDLFDSVKAYTMTSPERVYSLRRSVAHVVSAGVPGAIVECGVWRGGSMMVVARTLLELGAANRHLYLFDTFDGMSAPTSEDVDYRGRSAEISMNDPDDTVWCRASIEEVHAAMRSTNYPAALTHYVAGPVERTLPESAPANISLLRLDTDFYESTKHELVHLYPRLAFGGVLIIDDYGYWRGARKATDEYLGDGGVNLLLHRIDETARVGVKFPVPETSHRNGNEADGL